MYQEKFVVLNFCNIYYIYFAIKVNINKQLFKKSINTTCL